MSKRKNRVSLEDAVEDIMQWVDEGNPELEDDLDEVYGCDFNIETNVNLLDEDKVEAVVETEDVIESEDESGEIDPQTIVVNQQAPRKILTRNRLVNSIDAALNENDFDAVEPCNSKGNSDIENLTGYLGPKSDKNTRKISWTTSANVVGRQRACDIIGPHSRLRYAERLETITDCFDVLINTEMIKLIVDCTNSRLDVFIETDADKIQGNSRYGWIRRTDEVEIRALFGLMYLRGLLSLNNHSHDILFSAKAGHPMFGATMSRNRFSLLVANLSFDTPQQRLDNWRTDRFSAIRNIFELFNLNCLKHVIPSEFLSIDETLYPMRNQISFKQYNPNKPAKYGLLFKSLNDARFPYTYQSNVYSGKPVDGDGPFYISGTENYVKSLIEKTTAKLSLQGRNISTDRLYTSISLAEYFLEKKITCVGTMMTNRIGLPDEIKSPGDRENFSYSLHWESEKSDIALCSYIVKTKSKGKKSVILLSTMRPYSGVTRDDGKRKPQIYKLYDFTKGGTDIVDQKASQYTCKSKSKKWKLTAFFYILDTVRINATTMFALKQKKNPCIMNSFDVGFDLALSLVIPEVSRTPKVGLSKSIIAKMDIILDGVDQENVETDVSRHPPRRETKGYCTKCLDDIRGDGYNAKKAKLAKMKTQCQLCGDRFCPSHLVSVFYKHDI